MQYDCWFFCQFAVGGSGSKFYANSSGNGYFSNTLGIAGTNTGYKLYVNGKYVEEEFNHKSTPSFSEITVPKNQYFVMGDNRTNSLDSRMIGPFDKKYIKGKTSFVIFPFSRFGNKE